VRQERSEFSARFFGGSDILRGRAIDAGSGGRAACLPRPGLAAFLLGLLVALPMGWPFAFAFGDRAGNPTLANIHTLFSDPPFLDPMPTRLPIPVVASLTSWRRRLPWAGWWRAGTCPFPGPSAPW
jgi:hypothetical protein